MFVLMGRVYHGRFLAAEGLRAPAGSTVLEDLGANAETNETTGR